MEAMRYTHTFPNGGTLTCFTHDVLNYRYHRHLQHYEIDIVLSGRLEFARSGQLYRLGPDDVILVNPGEGHSTMALEPNTVTLVLRFSGASFQKFLEEGQSCAFHAVSDDDTRNTAPYRLLRLFCVLLLRSMAAGETKFSDTDIHTEFYMLRQTLFTRFEKVLFDSPLPQRDTFDDSIQQILDYIDENYAKKLSLEDLAQRFRYNRTYLSTFFKKNVGIGFYEHLTNIRFSHAVWDLGFSDISLTKVALYNGFPDLKTFNRLFQETFHLTPAEYRQKLPPSMKELPFAKQLYRSLDDPLIQRKLDEYALS